VSPGATPEEHYEAIVRALLRNPGVTRGSKETSSKRGFGSDAVRTDNRIFAMLSSKRRFVVKLPRRRVDALIASGAGERFDPGHGRLMKEWLAVNPTSKQEWLPLAREAMQFVASRR